MKSVHWMLCLAALWASEATALLKDLKGSQPEPPYHELSKQNYSISNKRALYGYSITYQKAMDRLVIGSPLEDKRGQVHLCPVKKSGNCNKANIVGDFKNEKANKIKHTWWLGATVDSGDSFFLACAPRWLDRELHTNGRCYYISTGMAEGYLASMKSLNKTQKTDYHVAAYGKEPSSTKPELLTDTFGLSSHVHNSSIFIGGPIMSIGRTQVYSAPPDSPYLIPVDNATLFKKGKSVTFSFGYSITSGYFVKSRDDIAVSTTYGTIGYGRIYFYSLDIYQHYTANDIWVEGADVANVGSLFGACLASLGLQEGRSALLVGAPGYASKSSSGYDVGAVFIYKFNIVDDEINGPSGKAELVKKLQSNEVKSGGRFGATIVTIGDFDDDKIDEVAIAAPFENDGSGVVYIYSGKKLLDKNTDPSVPWMQKLLPEESSNNLQFFGFSLTTLKDADENGCNELAIGAPADSSVTLLHCIASVKVSIEAEFPDLKEQANELNYKDTSFYFETCFVVENVDKPKTIETRINFKIQVIHTSVTMENSKNGTINYDEQLKPGTSHCKNIKVLLPHMADYDRDIQFIISVSVIENPLEKSIFNPHLVLINKRTSYAKLFTVPTLPGSILNYTIHTTFSESDEYLIGSPQSENLTIWMHNSGNTAYKPCVRVQLDGVTITHTPASRNCSFVDGELTCSIETLARGESWTVPVILTTKRLTSSQKQIGISSELFTSNCEISTGQTKNITIKLTRDSKFVFKTFSTPHFKVNVTEQDFIKGKNIDHIYEITNKGITIWTNVSCQVQLPPQVKVEKVTVTTRPPVKCEVEKNMAYCSITELSRNIPINVKIQMRIKPNSPFVDAIKKGKATVDTELRLMVEGLAPVKITTILTLWEAPKVPIWMYVVAALFGLLIIIIIVWVLHECGCLRRETKQKLQELKKDVKRQSMRKSTMLRQSAIEVIPNKDDRERLLKVHEEDAASHEGELHGHLNEMPVKEIHIDDNDPARVAFNAELAKTLAKGSQKVLTKAEIH